MKYAAGLYFDCDTANKLSVITSTVSIHGGNRYMIEKRIPPHITLSCFHTEDIQPIINALGNARTYWRVGEVFFASLGVFVPKVLYAAPVLNGYLHRLNREINDLIGNLSMPGDAGHYLPDQWVPHAALAVGLEKAALIKSFEAAVHCFSAFGGKAEKLFLAECDPYREIMVWDLLRA